LFIDEIKSFIPIYLKGPKKLILQSEVKINLIIDKFDKALSILEAIMEAIQVTKLKSEDEKSRIFFEKDKKSKQHKDSMENIHIHEDEISQLHDDITKTEENIEEQRDELGSWKTFLTTLLSNSLNYISPLNDNFKYDPTKNLRFFVNEHRQLKKILSEKNKEGLRLLAEQQKLLEEINSMAYQDLTEKSIIDVISKGLNQLHKMRQEWVELQHFFKYIQNSLLTTFNLKLEKFIDSSEVTQTLQSKTNSITNDLEMSVLDTLQSCKFVNILAQSYKRIHQTSYIPMMRMFYNNNDHSTLKAVLEEVERSRATDVDNVSNILKDGSNKLKLITDNNFNKVPKTSENNAKKDEL